MGSQRNQRHQSGAACSTPLLGIRMNMTGFHSYPKQCRIPRLQQYLPQLASYGTKKKEGDNSSSGGGTYYIDACIICTAVLLLLLSSYLQHFVCRFFILPIYGFNTSIFSVAVILVYIITYVHIYTEYMYTYHMNTAVPYRFQ